jgi:hypothetical protein
VKFTYLNPIKSRGEAFGSTFQLTHPAAFSAALSTDRFSAHLHTPGDSLTALSSPFVFLMVLLFITKLPNNGADARDWFSSIWGRILGPIVPIQQPKL